VVSDLFETALAFVQLNRSFGDLPLQEFFVSHQGPHTKPP
jgi:hypothetical protein